MVVKIAVLGAGIIGLSSAVKIKEKYNNLQVVLISSDFSPNTTGDGSAGLWYPYLCGSTPGPLLSKWGSESYDYLHQLWLEGGYGICLMPIFNLYRDKSHWFEPYWSKNVFGYHKLDEKDLHYLNEMFSGQFATQNKHRCSSYKCLSWVGIEPTTYSSEGRATELSSDYFSTFRAGHTFTTFAFSPPPFLNYLYQRFKKANGEVLQAKVNSLRDPILEGFDVVVNCTGLNAKYLVPDDRVFPYRGQVIKVVAPWINQAVIDEDRGNYIIPNQNTCTLGGTHQEHDYSTKISDADTEFILTGCKSIMPSLRNADIFSHWVGLRPGRHTVRLEAEDIDSKLIIHNYGHGGCGLTLFWGCATNVIELLEKHRGNQLKNQCKL